MALYTLIPQSTGLGGASAQRVSPHSRSSNHKRVIQLPYVLPVSLQNDAGPCLWDFVLSLFDQHPEGAHGLRYLRFPMACGGVIHLEVTGFDKPRYPDPGPWRVRGYTTTLPSGYMQIGGPGTIVEVVYDPIEKLGWVSLQIVCPSCMSPLDMVEDEQLRHLGCPEHGHQIVDNGGYEWAWLAEARGEGMREMRVTGRPGPSIVVSLPV